MSIDNLKNILPTPKREYGEIDWCELESYLKTSLPQEYKQFVSTYGPGGIDGFIWFYGPFENHSNINFREQVNSGLAVYKEMKQKFPDLYQFDLFPKVGGLLPFGITDNGDTLYWLTNGEPDNWSIVVHDVRSPEYEIYDIKFTSFLILLLNKDIECKIFPDDFPDNTPKFDVMM